MMFFRKAFALCYLIFRVDKMEKVMCACLVSLNFRDLASSVFKGLDKWEIRGSGKNNLLIFRNSIVIDAFSCC